MDNAAEINEDLKKILERIQGERAKLNADQPVELTGVDKSVAFLCDRIKKLPANEREKFKDSMVILVDEANQLTQDLISHRDALRKELGGISAHGKASQAYSRKPDSSS